MNKSTKPVLLLSIILFLLIAGIFGAGIAGEIYKWTDKDGNVHFGDKPENNPASVYKVPKGTAANVSSSNKERAKKQKKLLDSFEADRRSKKEKQTKKTKNKKTKQYNCQVSKDRLVRYQRASGIYTRNEVGEKKYLDNKQRDKEIALMKEQTKKWCQ